MNEIVLVHAAWHGAWSWERVRPLLEGAGRVVLTPTLAGSGERAAELSPAVTLEQHIDDVEAEIVSGGRRDVILVGHSYGGMVISGVAERAPDRLAALVYVDAFYPSDGESALDQLPAAFQGIIRQIAEEAGDGWRLPPNDDFLDLYGVNDPDLRSWIRPRLTDWSLNCMTAPLHAPSRRAAAISRSYLLADAEGYPLRAAFGPISEKAEADGCRLHRFNTGHELMLEAPQQLADILLGTVV